MHSRKNGSRGGKGVPDLEPHSLNKQFLVQVRGV